MKILNIQKEFAMFKNMSMQECKDKVRTVMQSGLPMSGTKVQKNVEKRFKIEFPLAFATTAITSLCKSGEVMRDPKKTSPIFRLNIVTGGRQVA